MTTAERVTYAALLKRQAQQIKEVNRLIKEIRLSLEKVTQTLCW
jgi:hypothetical protein